MKKLLALVCALIFTLLVVAGCSSSKKGSTTTTANPSAKTETEAKGAVSVKQDGHYTDKEHVAAYLHQFKKLPSNYITKAEATKLGWKEQGTLDKVAPGKSIGGDHFGNFEKLVPDKQGRSWKECDIDYVKGNRGAKRIVFSNDGLIYYSDSHYKNFVKLY
jgi:guanyl-specific ribonuclease Sa